MTFLFPLLGYLVGSIPFGFIFSKIFLGLDIRTIGSGNIGATNVFRTGSKKLTFLTLLCDMGKGVGMVALADYFSTDITTALTLIMVLVGHNFPIFLKFKGGKGFATTFGYFAYFEPVSFFMFGALWILVVLLFGYSSLGAIVVLSVFPFVLGFMTSLPLVIKSAFFFIAGLGLYRHKENIYRLLEKTESKTDLSKFIK